MADLKISQLTSATTPLAGTEVLPIVQGGTTKQVSIANLTAGRNTGMTNAVVSNGIVVQTSGVNRWIIEKGTGDSLFFYRYNDAGGYAGNPVRLNRSNGNVELENSLVPATAGQGINFTANTPAAGMTSQLLNWYEEGTWTPTLAFGGASTGITYVAGYTNGRYTRIGNRVFIQGMIILSSKGSATGDASINGLPFTNLNALDAYPAVSLAFRNVSYANQFQGLVMPNTTRIDLLEITEAGAVTSITDADFTNSSEVQFSASYCV